MFQNKIHDGISFFIPIIMIFIQKLCVISMQKLCSEMINIEKFYELREKFVVNRLYMEVFKWIIK